MKFSNAQRRLLPFAIGYPVNRKNSYYYFHPGRYPYDGFATHRITSLIAKFFFILSRNGRNNKDNDKNDAKPGEKFQIRIFRERYIIEAFKRYLLDGSRYNKPVADSLDSNNL